MHRRTSSIVLFFLLLALGPQDASSRTLEIGPGKEFATFVEAASNSKQGDTLLFAPGVHAGGGHVSDLRGTEDKPVIIRGSGDKASIIRGGSNAFQLTDAVFVRIENLVFEDQTGNGLNLDDGGSYSSPSTDIVIDNCEWRGMNATGNNDELKMSGVTDFVVQNCTFMNGAAGGSLVDMVGCTRGKFHNNTFKNGGSNSIQAKGGTSDILIERNRFFNGGERTINIGGSTGPEFFRPLGVDYEARNISVESNLIEGGTAAVAFVGAINSRVNSNTIIRPERWAIRILQESVEGFQPSGNNDFINNIVIFASTQPAINIGPNTAPQTFNFFHDLWYNPDNPNWSGPNQVGVEVGNIIQQDPQFIDAQYHIDVSSPAAGAGHWITYPEFDLYGQRFATPRSIGAVEVVAANDVAGSDEKQDFAVFPNPTSRLLRIRVPHLSNGRIFDVQGREVWTGVLSDEASIDVSSWPTGAYILEIGAEYYSVLIQ